MLEILEIQPFVKPVQGKVNIPGSKSITNRALLLAALNDKTIKLESALFSDDTRFMSECLAKLGFEIKMDENAKAISIHGMGGKIPNKSADLFVGNAGTAARFLTAFLATCEEGSFHLDGTPAMRKRPMKGLLEFLESKGAKFTFTEQKWHFPFKIETNGLEGGSWKVDASESSQILSALMMVAPCCDEKVTIELIGDTVSKPFVKMTADMMKQFGCTISSRDSMYDIPRSSSYSLDRDAYVIEPDATAASYFFSLPFVAGGDVEIQGIQKGALQGDTGFLDVLESLGFHIIENQNSIHCSFTKGNAIDGGEYDFNPISDTFLTLAALSPLMNKNLIITGIAHTRKQETDRIAAMSKELQKLGQGVIESEDSISITPNLDKLRDISKRQPIVHTYEDHRVSMAFAILGSFDLWKDGTAWLRIEDPYCCAKTFPNFYEELERIRNL